MMDRARERNVLPPNSNPNGRTDQHTGSMGSMPGSAQSGIPMTVEQAQQLQPDRLPSVPPQRMMESNADAMVHSSQIPMHLQMTPATNGVHPAYDGMQSMTGFDPAVAGYPAAAYNQMGFDQGMFSTIIRPSHSLSLTTPIAFR